MKPTFLRSALGFMSAATRWGNYLFPGITVLTRDFYDIAALHQFYCKKVASKIRPPLARLRSQRSDEEVGRELGRVLQRRGLPRPAQLTQQMTFWQRYGSFFQYFRLLDRRKPCSIEAYRKMVFSRSSTGIQEDRHRRERRIRHFTWYAKHKNEVLAHLGENPSGLLGRRWWLTGESAPDGVPRPIVLMRRLEFCFIVWQTAFEAAAWLLHQERSIPNVARLSGGNPVEFVKAFLAARDHPTSTAARRTLLRTALATHDACIRGTMKAWERRVRASLDGDANPDALCSLHNGESVASFAELAGGDLLEPLAKLHVHYSELQGKPQAVTVVSFKNLQPGPRFPTLNVEFSADRWGLHGYRLDAALVLHESQKYVS